MKSSVSIAVLALLLLAAKPLHAQNASLRVVHASPGTPEVDVRLIPYALTAPAPVQSLTFPNATGYITPASGLYNAFVTVAGSETVALSGAAELPAGIPVTVYAIGSLSLGKELNSTLQLKAVVDTFQTRPSNTATLVRVAHFSPDAPAVDVSARIGGVRVVLVENVSFSDVTSQSIAVPASVNVAEDSLFISPAGNLEAVVYGISFGELLTGQSLENNFTVAAVGFLGGTGNDAFRLKAYPVNPALNPALSALQVVHASPNTPAVDVYLNALELGAAQVERLAFANATGFLSVPSGNYLAYASVAGQTAPALTAAVTLAPNLAYSVFALDTLRLGNALNNNLKLLAVIDTFAAPPANTVAQVRVAHFSPDAPAVRVLLKLGANRIELLSSVSFLDFTTTSIAVPNSVSPETDSIIIALPNGAADVYSVSVGQLLGSQLSEGTTRFTVAAIGRLSLLGADALTAFDLRAYGTQAPLSSVRRADERTVAAYTLEQNYPNPFNPSTRIAYQLPSSGVVQLEVYDLLGRKVATLVNQRQDAGRYEVTFNAASLSSGLYFYRLQAGSFSRTLKMTLVK